MIDARVLEHADLLRGVSPEQVQEVVALAAEFSFREGEHFLRQGDPADTLFIIETGRVELTTGLNVFGVMKEVALEELIAGKTLGWSAMVEPYTLTLNARAVTATSLVGFRRVALHKLFAERTQIGFLIINNLLSEVGRRLGVTKALWLRELQRSVNAKYR